MTAASLRSMTCKDLGQMAKREGVAGWHTMRKEELVHELVRVGRRKKRSGTNGRGDTVRTRSGAPSKTGTRQPRVSRASRRIKRYQSAQKLLKLLAADDGSTRKQPTRDRLVTMVLGSYWLKVAWELRRSSVERASAALGPHWHTARPMLRLLAMDGSSKNAAGRLLRTIPVHGAVNHWYIDVTDPPGTYQVEIGYLSSEDEFYSISRSNIVTTPPKGKTDELENHWGEVARNCDKIYAMSGGQEINGAAGELRELFEERLRRPIGSPMVTRYGVGADGTLKQSDFTFELDAELIVYGATTPDGHLAFRGDPIELREDGTFTVRMSMPDGRQVVPVVATRADGLEQRTIVLGIERNTKRMETLVREPDTGVGR